MAGIHRAAASAARSFSRPIASASQHRRRAFAAAALEDAAYWTEWEDVEAATAAAAASDERDRRRREAAGLPATGACGDRGERGVQWVFMGSPGVQKRAYATRVAELLDVPYISTGALVRQELHPRSVLYKKIASAVNEGRLVPEDIIFGLLTRRLEEGWQRGETGFILDGIPRNRFQAEILDQITEIDLVVNFKSVEDCLAKKHYGLAVCSYCGKAFCASNSESTSTNPCLATRTRHAQLKSSSAIDLKDTYIKECHSYSEQSKLLEEYYKKQKKLLDFQASGGSGETWRGLLAALHLQDMDTVSSSHKLTA